MQTEEEYDEMRSSIACGARMVMSGACPGMCGDDYCQHHDIMLAQKCDPGQSKKCWEEFCAAEMAKNPPSKLVI